MTSDANPNLSRFPKRVLIPAAGRGERLDLPSTPKPLVTVGGLPILLRQLLQFQEIGIEEAVVITGYESHAIIRALTHHPRLDRLRVSFIEEPNWQQGLATSLLSAKDLFSEPFLLSMADHLFDDQLISVIARAKLNDNDDVIMIVDKSVSKVFDLPAAVKVKLEGEQVSGIGRHIEGYDAIDAGLILVRPTIFPALQQANEQKQSAELFEAIELLIKAKKVRALPTSDLLWSDVDSPAALIHIEMLLRSARRQQAMRPRIARVPSTIISNYKFLTGEPTTTEVSVGRGLASSEKRFDIGIPESSASSPIFVFTDTTVNALYGDAFVNNLEQRGYQVRRIVMPVGEVAKTISNFSQVVETVLDLGIDERSVLVSLGGGVVCNVCGFVASTLYRGVDLIHVPTTLMAQCDAAISHKQALNGARGKNLVGAYYAPIRIIVDVDFLSTLPIRLIRDGLSEALKHALCQDRAYLDMFLSYNGDIHNPEFLQRVVQKNIQLKCEIMAQDPKEHAVGMVLQYGHNVGHAVEYLSSYELTHGEAIAVGMMVSARVARLLGGAADSLVDAHDQVFDRYQLPRSIPKDIKVPDILEAIRYDKKYLVEGVRMALLNDVGKLWSVNDDYLIPVADDILVRALESSREGAS